MPRTTLLTTSLLAVLTLCLSSSSIANADPYTEPNIDVHSDHEDIIAKANQLETPLAMYKFVRNTIEYDVYYGSKKGAVGTLWSGRGNDFDQASLLIALLRAKGYRAGYKIGVVFVDKDQIVQWAGAKDFNSANRLFTYEYCLKAGSNFGLCKTDPNHYRVENTGIQIEHAWVEVELPATYRGLDVDDPEYEKVWVQLDPSWKQKDYPDPATAIDVPIGNEVYPGECSGKLCFDYEDFYSKVDPRLASEVWESEVDDWVAANYPGKTAEDVIFDGPIIPYEGEVLPAALPFINEPFTLDEDLEDVQNGEYAWPTVATPDIGTIDDGIERRYRIGICVRLEGVSGSWPPVPGNPCGNIFPLSYAAGVYYAFPEIVGKKLTLTFQPRNAYCGDPPDPDCNPIEDFSYRVLQAGGYHAGEYESWGTTYDTIFDYCLEHPPTDPKASSVCYAQPRFYLDDEFIEELDVVGVKDGTQPFPMLGFGPIGSNRLYQNKSTSTWPYQTVVSADYSLEIRIDIIPGTTKRDFDGSQYTAYPITTGVDLAIGLDADIISDVQIQDRIEALVALKEDMNLLFEGEGDANGNGVAGEVIVDKGPAGPDGVITPFPDCAQHDPQDPWRRSDVDAALQTCDFGVDAAYLERSPILGELLHVATLRYFQRGKDVVRRNLAIDGFKGASIPMVGVAKSGVDFTYLFEQPVGVQPTAPFMDVRGLVIDVHAIENEGLGATERWKKVVREGRLAAHVFSALEHQVWEELIGSSFISTVKGLQLVRERFPSEAVQEIDESNWTAGPNIRSKLENFPYDRVSDDLLGIYDEKFASPDAPKTTIFSPVAAVIPGEEPFEVYYLEKVASNEMSAQMVIITNGKQLPAAAAGSRRDP